MPILFHSTMYLLCARFLFSRGTSCFCARLLLRLLKCILETFGLPQHTYTGYLTLSNQKQCVAFWWSFQTEFSHCFCCVYCGPTLNRQRERCKQFSEPWVCAPTCRITFSKLHNNFPLFTRKQLM